MINPLSVNFHTPYNIYIYTLYTDTTVTFIINAM